MRWSARPPGGPLARARHLAAAQPAGSFRPCPPSPLDGRVEASAAVVARDGGTELSGDAADAPP